jgi:hypothetical protein
MGHTEPDKTAAGFGSGPFFANSWLKPCVKVLQRHRTNRICTCVCVCVCVCVCKHIRYRYKWREGKRETYLL